MALRAVPNFWDVPEVRPNQPKRELKFRRVGLLRLIQPNPPSWSPSQWEITLPLSGELGQRLLGSPYSRSIRNRSVTL